MATDFISREAAITAIFHHVTYKQGSDKAVAEIMEIPAADVRPVVRGEWEPSTEIMEAVDCSVCGFRTVYGAMPDGSGRDYNFCPSCGADMREETVK